MDDSQGLAAEALPAAAASPYVGNSLKAAGSRNDRSAAKAELAKQAKPARGNAIPNMLVFFMFPYRPNWNSRNGFCQQPPRAAGSQSYLTSMVVQVFCGPLAVAESQILAGASSGTFPSKSSGRTGPPASFDVYRWNDLHHQTGRHFYSCTCMLIFSR